MRRVDVNFFDPAAIDDPSPLYEQIRAVGNVVWNDSMSGWMVLGFAECTAILSDDGQRFCEINADFGLNQYFEGTSMISVDGAEHRRLRGAISAEFTRGAVAKWERRVEDVVDQLLAPLAATSEFDLISDFTMIPTIIVAQMLGVPKNRYQDFMRWSSDIISNLAFGHENEDAQEVIRRTGTELNSYLSEEIDRHRREQPDDLLTKMLQPSGAEAMTEAEIRTAAMTLLTAGYDTTAKTMSNALLALESHPEQRRLVAQDHTLIPPAVEEAMRWSGPVQFVPRRAMQDEVVDGTTVSEGDLVFSFLGAANRDPRRWTDPERFDVRREAKAHLGFGWGPHLCLGAPLARLETKVALDRLLRMAPEYRLRNIEMGPSCFVRGPERGTIEVGLRTTS